MVKRTLAAVRDVQQAWDFITADNEAAADRIANAIQPAAAQLVDFPRLGRTGATNGVRELVVARTPYRLVYRIRKSGIEILRVVHGKRDWPRRR